MSRPKIWFTSDTHYGHKNIVRGVSEWTDKSGCRDFDTLEEHDATVVRAINRFVKEDDILYHLGDWSFGGVENIWKFRKQIICKNIHLVLGNHDHHIKSNKSVVISANDVEAYNRIKKSEVYSNGYTVYAHGLFNSICKLDEINIQGTRITICHYPIASWNEGHKGTWMLHGHCHGTYKAPGNFRIIDVGLDANPQFRVYEYGELANIMKNKENLSIDHHKTEA